MPIIFKHLNSVFTVSFLTMTWCLMVMPDSSGTKTLGQQKQRLPSPAGSPQPGLKPWHLMLCPAAPSAQTTCMPREHKPCHSGTKLILSLVVSN